jgi:site-specific DNA recombinase
MIKRASIYARVSTPHQAEERTIENQVQALREYAKCEGYQLKEEHIYLDEGHSGSRLDRPALDRLRDDAYNGLFDVVLIYSPDRLARYYPYQVLLIEELERWGCEVIFLERPIGSNPEDRLLLGIQGAFFEYERAKMMERSRRGKIRKAKAGQIMNVRAPYGYKYIPKRDGLPPSIEIDEVEAGVVRQIFRWLLEGTSIRRIAENLTERNIPTKWGRKEWSRASVYAILTNFTYTGTLHFNRTKYAKEQRSLLKSSRNRKTRKRVFRPKEEWIPVEIPAIIDEGMYEKAQLQLRRNGKHSKRNNKRHPYLLRGLVRCGICGLAMSGYVNDGIGKYVYYRCNGKIPARAGQKICPSRMVRSERLDRVVWEAVVKLLKQPEVIKEYFQKLQSAELINTPLSERIKRLEGLIQRSEAQISRLIDAYAAEVIELEELAHRRERIEERISQLQKEVAELKEEQRQRIKERDVLVSLREFKRAVGEGLENLPFEQRQKLVRMLVEEVEVKGEDVEIKHIIPIKPFVDLRPISPLLIDRPEKAFLIKALN